MTRLLSAANLTAATSGHVRPVNFAQLDFDTATVYCHDGLGTFTWGGQNWLGVGQMGNVNRVQEAETINPYKLELTLSGLDPTLANEALNNQPYNRAISLFIGFLDASEQLVADPDEMWSGTIQQMNLTAGENNTCTIIAESDLIKLEKTNGYLFNDRSQQDRFTDDVLFEYQSQIIDAKPVWLGPTRTGRTFNNDQVIPPIFGPGFNIGF